jgi:hypothetical protein
MVTLGQMIMEMRNYNVGLKIALNLVILSLCNNGLFCNVS